MLVLWLLKAGLFTERQKPIPLIYDEVKLDCGYRADLVVEKKVIIEVKAVEALNEIHLMQTLTHIKLLDYRLGLLMNFNVPRLPEGVKRVVNHLNWHWRPIAEFAVFFYRKRRRRMHVENAKKKYKYVLKNMHP